MPATRKGQPYLYIISPIFLPTGMGEIWEKYGRTDEERAKEGPNVVCPGCGLKTAVCAAAAEAAATKAAETTRPAKATGAETATAP